MIFILSLFLLERRTVRRILKSTLDSIEDNRAIPSWSCVETFWPLIGNPFGTPNLSMISNGKRPPRWGLDYTFMEDNLGGTQMVDTTTPILMAPRGTLGYMA